MRVNSCPHSIKYLETNTEVYTPKQTKKLNLHDIPLKNYSSHIKRSKSEPTFCFSRKTLKEELVEFSHSVAISGLVSGAGTLFCFGVLGIPPLVPAALTFFAAGAIIGYAYPKIKNAVVKKSN